MKRAQILRPKLHRTSRSPSSDSVAVNLVIVGAIFLLIAYGFRSNTRAAIGATIVTVLAFAAYFLISAARQKRRLRELAFAHWLKVVHERADIFAEKIDAADPYWRECFENKVSSHEALFEYRRQRDASPGKQKRRTFG
jgi:hypothetical protein